MDIFADKARLASTRRIMIEKALRDALDEGEQAPVDIYNMCRCYVEAYEQDREARREYNEYRTNAGGDKAGA